MKNILYFTELVLLGYKPAMLVKPVIGYSVPVTGTLWITPDKWNEMIVAWFWHSDLKHYIQGRFNPDEFRMI